MIRSVSQSKNLSKEALFSFTNYQNDFQTQRNSRTLSLRRQNRDQPISLFKVVADQKSRVSLEAPKIETSDFLEVFNSGDEVKIIQLSDAIFKAAQAAPRSIQNIAQSRETMESYGYAFVSAESDNLIMSLLNSILVVFPLCDIESADAFIDTEISLKYYSLLLSENEYIILKTINLIITTSQVSAYCRDSILSFGVHETLISVAENAKNEFLAVLACEALDAIFKHHESIDCDKYESCVDSLIRLTQIPYPEAVNSILSILSSLSKHIIYQLFDNSIDQIALNFLQTPELVENSIILLGNMYISNMKYSKRLANAFIAMISFIQSEYAAYALCTMANLYEIVSADVQSYITPEFIRFIVDIGTTSSCEVKKMVAYFLSTLVLFMPSSLITSITFSELIEIFVEMLGCGIANIILRCIQAIDKILDSLRNSKGIPEALQIIDSNEILDILDRLISDDQQLVSVYASAMSQKITKLIR
ncbi:hypothetical protein TRFO_06178 [Tritrichomonas foetus]|uniref:Uncharacterized protein n=1 Tax=Tritrichomonas foetus TaxID=1144522 RepID=A0A1J4K001_9EUKA|nr:hypothetical protein TRFO_06178 [Tritrichomonas foetus]|eukprot:OHT04745.1 hypothetical protein TRFO_06178 [Tritrichomonas foetus]